MAEKKVLHLKNSEIVFQFVFAVSFVLPLSVSSQTTLSPSLLSVETQTTAEKIAFASAFGQCVSVKHQPRGKGVNTHNSSFITHHYIHRLIKASCFSNSLSIGTTPTDSQTNPPPKLESPAITSGESPNATQQAAIEMTVSPAPETSAMVRM